jgi:hypothetical protein
VPASRSFDFAAWSGPLTGATFLTGVFGGIVLADSPFPRPGSPDSAFRDYYEQNPSSAVMSAAGQLASTACLAQFALTVDHLARRFGSPWLRIANAAGAAVAVAGLAASGVTTAQLRGPARHDPARAARLARRSFVAGGPVHGVGFGLMTAALALAGRHAGVLGPGAARVGLVSAGAGMLCPAYFLAEPAGWLIPVGRFTGLAVAATTGRRLAELKR